MVARDRILAVLLGIGFIAAGAPLAVNYRGIADRLFDWYTTTWRYRQRWLHLFIRPGPHLFIVPGIVVVVVGFFFIVVAFIGRSAR